MINKKILKNNPSFRCNAEVLSDALLRIKAVSDYGKVSGTVSIKSDMIIAQKGKLIVLSASLDVVAYIVFDAVCTIEGSVSIDIDTIVGILKKRKGSFEFKCSKSELSFKLVKGKYSGKINIADNTDSVEEILDSLGSESNTIDLTLETMVELKKAVKSVTAKDVVYLEPMNIHLSCTDGKLRATSHDAYHALVYTGETDTKCDDFQLSVTGSAYNVLEKFIASQTVSFSVGKSLSIVKEGHMLCSIPPIQSKEDDFEIFDKVRAIKKQKKSAEMSFVIPGPLLKDRISNMVVLKNSSLEVTAPFQFEKNESLLSITYKTSAGSVTDSIPCEGTGSGKFTIGEKLITDMVALFCTYEEITVTINKGSFLFESNTETESLIGVGSRDYD